MRNPLTKVPEVTIFFWIIKVLTTGMGETTSDFLVKSINPIIAVGIGAIGLAIALTLQFGAAVTLHLGYFSSGVMFAILIAFVTAAQYLTKGILSLEHRHQTRNAVLAFWLAYILTRPLGASFADWMGVSHARGGLDWGTG